MTADEAVRDLLTISTDVRRVAILGPGDEVLAAAPSAPGGAVEAAERLWAAAERRAASDGQSPLEYVVTQDRAGGVAIMRQEGRRIIAVTAPNTAVGLLLFDLRTCLADAAEPKDAS